MTNRSDKNTRLRSDSTDVEIPSEGQNATKMRQKTRRQSDNTDEILPPQYFSYLSNKNADLNEFKSAFFIFLK
jgi:hypothetical protein